MLGLPSQVFSYQTSYQWPTNFRTKITTSDFTTSTRTIRNQSSTKYPKSSTNGSFPLTSTLSLSLTPPPFASASFSYLKLGQWLWFLFGQARPPFLPPYLTPCLTKVPAHPLSLEPHLLLVHIQINSVLSPVDDDLFPFCYVLPPVLF